MDMDRALTVDADVVVEHNYSSVVDKALTAFVDSREWVVVALASAPAPASAFAVAVAAVAVAVVEYSMEEY